MRTVFQQELGEVQSRLVTLANEAKTIMEKASKAFLNSDVAMADEALALTDANEERALDLDELVIKVLATQSPVARDLRILVSALRMSASLERMGSLTCISHRCNCSLPLSRKRDPRQPAPNL